MSFHQRMSEVRLRDMVRHSEIQKEIKAELPLHIERCQLRWFGNLVRMPPWELFWDRPIGWRPLGRPRTQWRDNFPQMAWNHLQIPLIELVEIAHVTHETPIWIRAWQYKDICFCSSLLCLVYLLVNSQIPHIGLVLIIPIHLLIIVAGQATSLLQVTT